LGDYFPFGFQPIFTGELAVTRVLKTKTAEKGAKTNPPKNQRLEGPKMMQFVGINSLDFWGCILFFKQ